MEREPAFIGAIHPGATIDVVSLADSRAIVEIRGAPLKVADGAKLFVSPRDLEGCTRSEEAD